MTNTYSYTAFGEVHGQIGTKANDYLFTEEQFDPSLDQYYLRTRYYDQGTGWFTQQDTWKFLGIWHNLENVAFWLIVEKESGCFTN